MSKETSKATRRRWCEDECGIFPWRSIFVGKGIDVGCGDNPLPFDGVTTFDMPDGDANNLAAYFPENHFDYLHASQCLEHMHAPRGAIDNWLRVVRPGGHAIITIPSWELYEGRRWPSAFNPDHKSTWSMEGYSSPAGKNHIHVPELMRRMESTCEILLCRELVRHYDHSVGTMRDQTLPESAGVEPWIEFVLRKNGETSRRDAGTLRKSHIKGSSLCASASLREPITPVIVRASRQAAQVDALVEHCRRLDGTEIRVIEAEELGLPYPHRNNRAFWQAAQVMSGKPFLWMEPDCAPIRAGWLDAISKVYRACGKPILISSDENPPVDLVGGIGVYGPEAHWMFPERIESGEGFDGWMLRHLGPLIARDPIIQHSYNLYRKDGDHEHRFPRDHAIVRPQSAIFHRDRHQDLIRLTARNGSPLAPSEQCFFHTGDMGDIIAALPVIEYLGGGHLAIANDPTQFLRAIEGPRFEFLRPLLEAQPYIRSVTCRPRDPSDVDMSQFRKDYLIHRNLAESQAAHLGVEDLDLKFPWLHLPHGWTPAVASHDSQRVVIARSARYHNPRFSWKHILRIYGPRCLFVGLPEEHHALESATGIRIERAEPSDALELARIISAAWLFVGNQSLPFWIAAGLGVQLIQETCPERPDSIITGRSNTQYVLASDHARYPAPPSS